MRAFVRLAAELVAVAVGVATITALLTKLSGTALRLPPPWGWSVQIMLPAAGVAFYTFCRLLARLLRASWQDWAITRQRAAKPTKKQLDGRALKKCKERAYVQWRVFATGVAVLALAGALWAVLRYNHLHEQCAFQFNVPVRSEDPNYDWYESEFGSPKTGGSIDDVIPRFVLRETNIIYLPLVIPYDVKNQVEARGNGSFEQGIFNLLQSADAAPIELIDWILASPEYPKLMKETQKKFYWLHALILALVALAAGFVFAPAQSLANELVDIVT